MSNFALRSPERTRTVSPQDAQRAQAQQHEEQRRRRLGQRMTAVIAGVIAAAVLVILIALGSRGFQWFDSALIGYAVGTIFALAAVTYKYTFWLMRPQTGRYFKRGWQLFFSLENFQIGRAHV